VRVTKPAVAVIARCEEPRTQGIVRGSFSLGLLELTAIPVALRLQEPLTLGLRLCFSMTSDRHDASTGWWRGGGPMSSLLFWLRIGAVHKGAGSKGFKSARHWLFRSSSVFCLRC
jgi:hypothetical protein